MILANVKGRATTYVDGVPVDVASHSLGALPAEPAALYRHWDELLDWATDLGATGRPSHPRRDLGAPSPSPAQVFGIGLNYGAHATESGVEPPDFPSTFTKFPSCVVGPDHPVVLAGDTTDWEVEVVVIMGRTTRRVSRDSAWHYVAGLTIGQDLSERTRQLAGPLPQFSLGKSYPGYGPTGPWLVTPDELPDPDDLAISCTLDGERVQHARTSDLVFPIPDLIAQLSAIVTLQPGDLVFTGTPAGVGMARSPARYLRAGQELYSEVEGIGALWTRLVGDTGD